ncbi:hypothetical protein QJS10_CPB21g01314 [Acorus calamus]|uniref:Uncharacterized protein n=1 Tax=Acorus calamus TaxID=4465 RepID=A0AAV9C2G8_ACOCL|nr:hypothetical protein QJS10_CPB21g01314 [Acorus calamus]
MRVVIVSSPDAATQFLKTQSFSQVKPHQYLKRSDLYEFLDRLLLTRLPLPLRRFWTEEDLVVPDRRINGRFEFTIGGMLSRNQAFRVVRLARQYVMGVMGHASVIGYFVAIERGAGSSERTATDLRVTELTRVWVCISEEWRWSDSYMGKEMTQRSKKQWLKAGNSREFAMVGD